MVMADGSQRMTLMRMAVNHRARARRRLVRERAR
jgi:hypothetical protein